MHLRSRSAKTQGGHLTLMISVLISLSPSLSLRYIEDNDYFPNKLLHMPQPPSPLISSERCFSSDDKEHPHPSPISHRYLASRIQVSPA
jgi:hypothetical protein